jgi:subtilisin family serine protease
MLSKSSSVERSIIHQERLTSSPVFSCFFSFIEVDFEIYMSGWPDDPTPPRGWRLPDLSSYGITLAQGDSSAIPSSGKLLQCDDPSALKVAFVNGGVYYFHEDSPCSFSASNCDGASLGTTDPWYSPDAAWHGTHALGIVGAVGGNGKGVAGMVPQVSSGVCYLFARVTRESSDPVRWSDALAGVEWSLDKGADVINLSFCGKHSEVARRFLKIAKQNGAISVAGSGNSSTRKQEYP